MVFMTRKISELYLKAAVAGHKTYFVVLVEAVLILCSAVLGFYLRLEAWPTMHQIVPGVTLLIAVRLLFLARYNLLRGWWRYTGFNEVVGIAKASALGTVFFYFLHHIAIVWAGNSYAWP